MSLLMLLGSLGTVGRLFATIPSSVNFGNVVVGATSKKSITITNNTQYAWYITAVNVTGVWFKVSGLSLPLTIKPGLSASFTISFTPSTTGTFTGSVALYTNSTCLGTISLTGTGVTLLLSLSPTSLKFGNVVVGDTAVLSAIITSTGTAAVTISSATVSGTGFKLGNLTLPLTLNAGQSTSFSVSFAPATTGTFGGTVWLKSNATNSPSTESLSGAGVLTHSVSLTWTASTSTGVTGYNVYRGTVSGGPYTQLNASLVSGTSYTDTTVSAGQTYYYVTTTMTSTTQSGYSNQAVAAVP
jgi:centrosomal CEP192-like protein/HYDIN/CFA65/VesB family protein